MNIPGAMYTTGVQHHSHSTSPLVLCHVTHTQTPPQGLNHLPSLPSTAYLPGVFINCVSISLRHVLRWMASFALALDIQRLKDMKKKRETACSRLGILCMPVTPSPRGMETKGLLGVSGFQRRIHNPQVQGKILHQRNR